MRRDRQEGFAASAVVGRSNQPPSEQRSERSVAADDEASTAGQGPEQSVQQPSSGSGPKPDGASSVSTSGA
jgi:hypothetical protein